MIEVRVLLNFFRQNLLLNMKSKYCKNKKRCKAIQYLFVDCLFQQSVKFGANVFLHFCSYCFPKQLFYKVVYWNYKIMNKKNHIISITYNFINLFNLLITVAPTFESPFYHQRKYNF